MWKAKGRVFPAEGTERTLGLCRAELGDRLDAAVPAPVGGGICLSVWPLMWVGVGFLTPWQPQGTQTLAWQLGAASISPRKTKPITPEPWSHTAVSAVINSST